VEFCSGRNLPADAEFQLNVVLEELFVNAIRHGGCDGVTDAACIRLDCTPENAVHIEFRDRGRPFDLTAAPAADIGAPLSERHGGGLGIHLVRQMMRDVAYRREGEWNILTMLHPVAKEQETL
jgi:anti-sigma regulatory factor (Ser/Thr protein kinase)